jgi:cytochrome c-type biogenesis protein CcmF
MVPEFGYGILFVTFLATLYSVGAAALGGLRRSPSMVESARRGMMLTFPLLSISAGVLIYLLVNNRFDISFVYEVTSRSMPTYLKVTAWWGGQAGSLLFWSWLLAAFASAVTLRKWDRDREFLPWVIVVASTTLAFFLMMVIFFENPFARYFQTSAGVAAYTIPPAGGVPFMPPDGRGLNPLLRHPGMVIHPPMLYLGFVSFVIPYAFAIAALVTGRTDDRWIRLTRRWALWAWLFLSFGLVLGGRWAYDVLGWGGYWGWDPVEIAAFMPWLSGTAFLHSVMIQEKRGLLKHWNMILIVLTYALVIFGTFLTRSGVLSSVHAFAQSAIGPLFFGFIGATFITSIGLIIWRWPDLHGEMEMSSMLSREALFLLNNLLFMLVLAVCFLGVLFPLASELVTGQKVTVGPPWYERINAPLFAALIFLMGVAPLSAWGHSTLRTLGRGIWKAVIVATAVTVGLYATYTKNVTALIGFFLIALVVAVTLHEFWRATRARQRAQQEPFPVALGRLVGRDRRRYGGYIVHLSMMFMAVGILGIEIFQLETQDTLATGESIAIGGYTLKYEEIAEFSHKQGHDVIRAVVGVYEGDSYRGQLYPRIDYYYDPANPAETVQPMTIPGQRPTLKDDLYVLLIDWQPATSSGATFKAFVNPLVNSLWLGSFLFLFGVLVAAWPGSEPERLSARVGKPALQPTAAD